MQAIIPFVTDFSRPKNDRIRETARLASRADGRQIKALSQKPSRNLRPTACLYEWVFGTVNPEGQAC
jgi:hypothetical protein